MRSSTPRHSSRASAVLVAAVAIGAIGAIGAISACGSSEPDGGAAGGGPQGGGDPSAPGVRAKTPEEQIREILDSRKYDYGEAARTAKLKLNDELPTFEEIQQIANAPDDAAKKLAYEKLVDAWIAGPRFASTMVKFWRDAFRTGQTGAVQNGQPDKDKAALFAAQITVEGRNYTELFTASSNTCPTFDAATGTFAPANCNQPGAGAPTAGVLTDPGLMAQYAANMAFRRVRFIQETFACAKFPAEYSAAPTPMGAGTYTSPWDFGRVVGKTNDPNAKVDFSDTTSTICANCHTTLNGMAPLFVRYDDKGVYQATSQVEVPVPGSPKADPEKDYLAPGQSLAWRFQKTITDIPSLGQAIAADPDVAHCAVDRVWNYAMSRGDMVNDLAAVPRQTTDALVQRFAENRMNLKEIIVAVFKGEDFVKF